MANARGLRYLPNPLSLVIRGFKNVTKRKKPWENEELLHKVKKMYGVKGVAVDQQNRIIITTQPMYLRENGSQKVIGQYQIRIDFLHSTNMIQMLNISQRYHQYDHPGIQDTHPCWGNIEEEIENLWVRQDLEKLVDLCIYSIGSSNTEHTYTRWPDWFKGAILCPRGYNFDQYDKGIRPKRPDPEPSTAPQAPTFNGDLSKQHMYMELQSLYQQAQFTNYMSSLERQDLIYRIQELQNRLNLI